MSEHIARQLWLGEPEEGKAGLTVAFASADHKRVDQHFGSCASLLSTASLRIGPNCCR